MLNEIGGGSKGLINHIYVVLALLTWSARGADTKCPMGANDPVIYARG